jgi:hypothetical protein
MKAKSILLILGLLVLSTACKKEEVRPDQEDLVGIWFTKDTSTDEKIEFTMREIYIYPNETSENPSLNYYYNIKNNSLYLYPYQMNDPDKFSTHAIYLNEKTDELKIWKLPGVTSDDDGFTVFIRQ